MRTDTTSATSAKTAAQRVTRAVRPAAPPPGPRGRERAAHDHDRVALDEIELYAELIIAAERSDERLPQEDIDRILGLTVRA